LKPSSNNGAGTLSYELSLRPSLTAGSLATLGPRKEMKSDIENEKDDDDWRRTTFGSGEAGLGLLRNIRFR
jgi:hypothetical protein